MNVLAVAIWIAVVVSTVLLLRALRRSRPPSAGPAPRLHDLSEAAFMAGGPGAVVDCALVSMLGDGRLVVGGPGIVQASPGARAGDTAERAVLEALRQAPSGWLYQVRYAAMVDPAVQETGDALAARGLLAAPGSGAKLRRWALIQVVVCAVWLVFSLPLTFVALALESGPQVPFAVKVFPALVGGIVMGCALAARARQRLTPAGRAALREVRAQYLNDQTPHVQTALYGLRGLRDPYLREQLVPAARSTRLAAAQSRPAPRGSSSSSSPSSSSSSDSCGSSAAVLPVVWCAGSSDGGGGSGAGCGSTGSGCGSSGSGSSCSSGSGSSCSSGSGSGCGSSSGSSCASSSSSCSSGSSCSSSSGSSCGSSSS
ncbi:TIGR04222 domain-containing membrane protein [Streptomyces sp. NPDC057686]|uniref:TIGR04222 domain-containing membrane protein n=1 Tax=Streptomyces sp. NPDC057686 TaxID=3346212 RepID=UPI0036832367